jgi:hypothetical protein
MNGTPLKLDLIPLSQIVTWWANPPGRIKPKSDGWKEFVESIRTNGQLMPVVVVAEGDRYRLVDGHRRVAALHELGRGMVLALVSPLSYEEAQAAYGKAEQLKLRWEGKQLGGLPGYLGWDLALNLMTRSRRRVMERALAQADPDLLLQAGETYGTRAIAFALGLVTDDWPLNRVLRALLAYGSYNSLEERVSRSGLSPQERRRRQREILAFAERSVGASSGA